MTAGAHHCENSARTDAVQSGRSQENAKEVINRAQRATGASKAAFDEPLALFSCSQFGELHDQDGVLSGESDEHDQANLA